MNQNREWMYGRRFLSDGSFNPEFFSGVQEFISFATNQPKLMDGDKIKCPCKSCRNIPFKEIDSVLVHLFRKGFTWDYHMWRFHGETSIPINRYWYSEDVVQKSRIAKNWILKYKGGSKSQLQCAEEMAEESECPPKCFLWRSYVEGHTKADGTHTDAKSERIGIEIKARAARLSEETGVEVDDKNKLNDIFIDVIEGGPNHKKMVSGVDEDLTRVAFYPVDTSTTSTQRHSAYLALEEKLEQTRAQRMLLTEKFEAQQVLVQKILDQQTAPPP